MDLLDGEKVLFRGRPSWRSMVAFYVKWTIVALIPGVALQVLRSSGAWSDAPVVWGWLATVVIVLLMLLIGWLKRIDTLYTITDKRIHIRTGILSRRDQSTSHDRIQNVNTEQGLLQRMLNVGDVDFDTAGTTDYDFRFNGVDDPGRLVRLVASIERGEAAGTTAAPTGGL